MSKLKMDRIREVKGKMPPRRWDASRARRRLDMDRVDGISHWLAGQEPVAYQDSLSLEADAEDTEQEPLDLTGSAEMELCKKLEYTRMA